MSGRLVLANFHLGGDCGGPGDLIPFVELKSAISIGSIFLRGSPRRGRFALPDFQPLRFPPPFYELPPLTVNGL
jgi:hypothetical protein